MRPMMLLLSCLAALALTLGASTWAEEPALGSEAETTPALTAETTAPPAPSPDEDADMTLADVMAEIGADLSEAEWAAVRAYDASPDPAAFEWPENDDGDSMADDIIGYIKAYNDVSGFTVNNLWVAIAAMLVFIMHLGFATLESGLTQAKNTVNILFKNTFIVCIGLMTYAICGFSLMYPGEAFAGGFFGFDGWGVGPGDVGDPLTFWNTMSAGYGEPYTYWTDFFFQAMFAATAATIISGCVAERIKLLPFLVFATIYVGFLYPWVGFWHWGEGWLEARGFVDYAGSTLVHSVGGWGGLAAILVLGPRKGKYVDGKVRPILSSNLPLATIGVFLLWFGWFGFNGGSALSAEPAEVALVLVQTSFAAALGGLTAGIVSWIVGGKPDLTMALNGILAGLVGITAAPDTTMLMTLFTGVSSGVIVYFAVLGFDALKIDDPVGALSVHLVCGVWGTFLAGFHPDGDVGVQIIGIIAYAIVCFLFALVLALVVKSALGWRVSEEEEVEGLDAGEHGMSAYHGLSLQ